MIPWDVMACRGRLHKESAWMTEAMLIDWDRLGARTSLEFYPLCELKSFLRRNTEGRRDRVVKSRFGGSWFLGSKLVPITDPPCVPDATLSGAFTAVPFDDFWNMRRENLSSRSNIYEICSKWIGSGGIPKNSKSKTPCADSNFGPRCEGSGKTKDMPTLGPRVEARNETRNPVWGRR
ncbi:hypothetical protein AVEN_264227-1 [Araneus ventricosus]|uniref:Uncharacterized protein n=1 Tax=Araneus ventricosus TaxID=182803 RepID=A0A4Y2J1C9_ARAVE|nr:hypothetical protein AVEN_264227-1 [Araneus ventricosus]